MDRRDFLGRATVFPLLLGNSASRWREPPELKIEKGALSPDPIPEPHFPDRMHLFIWRNWELANTDRLAQVLGATPEQILEIGSSLGLLQKPELSEDQLRRIYITVVPQNWHVLPDEQLMELLGWDPRRYEYTLKEDDFLWIKLGLLRPRCERLRYEPPSSKARRRAAEIKQILREELGASADETGEPPFEFVAELSGNPVNNLRDPESKPAGDEVDLSRGWVIAGAASQEQAIQRLAQEFRAFMQAAFSAEISLGGEADTKAGRIYLSIDPAAGGAAGGFELRVQPQEVRVTGRDLGGLQQALDLVGAKMEARGGPYLARGLIQRTTQLDPRYAYSYFALYGDPLMERNVDPFPHGFLEKLSRSGERRLAAGGPAESGTLKNLPEFGAGAETRLGNLRTLVDRANAWGVKVYLYLNEPRSMPTEFFVRYPQIKGAFDADDPHFYAMCTSSPEVRDWIRESLAHIFGEVRKLGGVFAITASENLTNSYSHGRAQFCPRCSKRNGDEVVAEVIQTFRDGVRKSSGAARVIAWDWGWGEDRVKSGASPQGIIARLPTDVELLSVREWSKPIERGGVRTKVGEYSISVVGPAPRARETRSRPDDGVWGFWRKSSGTILGKSAQFPTFQFPTSWWNTARICGRRGFEDL